MFVIPVASLIPRPINKSGYMLVTPDETSMMGERQNGKVFIALNILT